MSYVPSRRDSGYRRYRGFYEYSSGGYASSWIYLPTFWQRFRGLPGHQGTSASFYVKDILSSNRDRKAQEYIDKLWATKSAQQIADGDFDKNE